MYMNTEPSLFSIVLSKQQMDALGCTCHIEADNMDLWFTNSLSCRPCSVTLESYNANLPVVMADGWVDGAMVRRITGTVSTPAQRVALTRVLAISQGHDEPWLLIIRDHHNKAHDDDRISPTMLEELGDLGITAPPYAYLQYWLKVGLTPETVTQS